MALIRFTSYGSIDASHLDVICDAKLLVTVGFEICAAFATLSS